MNTEICHGCGKSSCICPVTLEDLSCNKNSASITTDNTIAETESRICEHGSLRRQCGTCEDKKEIEQLQNQLTAANAELNNWHWIFLTSSFDKAIQKRDEQAGELEKYRTALDKISKLIDGNTPLDKFWSQSLFNAVGIADEALGLEPRFKFGVSSRIGPQ